MTPEEIAPGLVIETVGDILDRSDEDRAARMFAEALKNEAPAEKTAFDAIKIDIDDLYDEAKNWLDGTEIKTQAEADDVATLIDRFRKAGKAAKDQHTAEKKPHLEAGRAVDAKFKPLIERADTAKDIAERARNKYLLRLKAAQEEIARAAAKLAAEEAQKARDAIAQANATADLDAREKAEDLVADAKAMLDQAAALAKAKPLVRGGEGERAQGLRGTWTPTLTDSLIAMRHYWLIPERKAEFETLMLDMARKDVRAGARAVPGFTVTEEFKL